MISNFPSKLFSIFERSDCSVQKFDVAFQAISQTPRHIASKAFRMQSKHKKRVQENVNLAKEKVYKNNSSLPSRHDFFGGLGELLVQKSIAESEIKGKGEQLNCEGALMSLWLVVSISITLAPDRHPLCVCFVVLLAG